MRNAKDNHLPLTVIVSPICFMISSKEGTLKSGLALFLVCNCATEIRGSNDWTCRFANMSEKGTTSSWRIITKGLQLLLSYNYLDFTLGKILVAIEL